MRVTCPFWDLNLFARFVPQFEALASRVDEFTIVYETGEVLPEWELFLTFEKIETHGKVSSWNNRLGRVEQYLEIARDTDILYCLSGFWFEVVSWYAKRELNKPLVMRLRGNDIRMRRETRGKLQAHLYQLVYRFMWKSYDAIIPISMRFKDLWETRHKLTTLTMPVYNGVDAEMFRHESTKSIVRNLALTVGYVGRISKEKGGEVLNEIMHACPDVKFIVAGSSVHDLEFPENCKYLGWLDQSELYEKVYSKIDYTILPSFYEGVPNVILESYLCDTPVIVARRAVPWDIQIFGYVLDYKPETWIKLLNMILYDAKPNIHLRGYVRDNFTWQNNAEKIIATMHALM